MWAMVIHKLLICVTAIVVISACKSDAKSTDPQPISFTIPRLTYTSDIYLQPLAEEQAMQYHLNFNQAFQMSGVTGLSACILDLNQGLWSDVSGLEDKVSNRMIRPSSKFHAGSIGKLATASLILSSIEKGHFSLNTTIDKWFPDSQYSSSITVDNLLNHTSGLPGNLTNDVSQELALRKILNTPLLFTPGKGFSYSNAGYVALGIILEKELEQPLPAIIKQHVIDDVGLRNTAVVTAETQFDVLIGSTYNGQPGAETIDYSSPAGAGILASTPCDLIQLLHHFLAEQIVSAATLNSMQQRAYPMAADGSLNWSRGLMVLDAPFGRVMFLNGSIKGFGATVAYHAEREVFVSVMLNDDTQVVPFLMRFFSDINTL